MVWMVRICSELTCLHAENMQDEWCSGSKRENCKITHICLFLMNYQQIKYFPTLHIWMFLDSDVWRRNLIRSRLLVINFCRDLIPSSAPQVSPGMGRVVQPSVAHWVVFSVWCGVAAPFLPAWGGWNTFSLVREGHLSQLWVRPKISLINHVSSFLDSPFHLKTPNISAFLALLITANTPQFTFQLDNQHLGCCFYKCHQGNEQLIPAEAPSQLPSLPSQLEPVFYFPCKHSEKR